MTRQAIESLSLRPREAAKALGISERTLWSLTAPRGPIPCVRVGTGKRRVVLYPTADLEAWLSREAEAMLAVGGQMEITRDWGAKLAGATVRLAAVLIRHLVFEY